MRRELVQVKEEMVKELSVIKRVLQHIEQTVETLETLSLLSEAAAPHHP